LAKLRSYPPPQVGFNNNVKHRGRVFHIQTEDSGVNHPHVITLLFADGGRIVRRERTDYSDMLHHDDLVERVRRCMKEQHKNMFKALREGRLDALIDEMFDPAELRVAAGDTTPRAVPQPSTPPSKGSSGARSKVAAPRSGRETVSSPNHPGLVKTSAPSASMGRPKIPNDSPASGPLRSSLYGGESLDEQSLDDVILSYISEDLDGTPGKKE
jgi:hypothetical protein